jgi:hypothetical protein
MVASMLSSPPLSIAQRRVVSRRWVSSPWQRGQRRLHAVQARKISQCAWELSGFLLVQVRSNDAAMNEPVRWLTLLHRAGADAVSACSRSDEEVSSLP